eukprot:gb/GFBE01063282.1/.p1 GENE.gb/GFBE01063282.1/~~gb/GFBE01063282.1/.p1  ORF type:complete len:207 (+),score=34.96 gb/GFBE01063282.1/:1-621(+)
MASVANDEHIAQQLQQAEMGLAPAAADARGAAGAPPVVQGVPVTGPGVEPVLMGAGGRAAMPPVAVVAELPVEEVVVLNYRMGLMCFATMDLLSTVLNAVSAFTANRTWGLLVLVFLIGPLSGLVGASRLNRPLVSVYLAFCVLKAGFQIAFAVYTLFLWPVFLALIQFWITKIVATFWHALGAIPPERRAQLADEKDVPVHMVYW